MACAVADPSAAISVGYGSSLPPWTCEIRRKPWYRRLSGQLEVTEKVSTSSFQHRVTHLPGRASRLLDGQLQRQRTAYRTR